MTVIKNMDGTIIAQSNSKTLKEWVKENRHKLFNVNLEEADLSYINLGISHAELANFEKANLSHVYLGHANLKGTNFRGAYLEDTTFFDANLKGADFSQADVRFSLFDDSDLENAIFKGANIRNVIFLNATLKGAVFSRDMVSIEIFKTIEWGFLSNELTLELMRRDATAHPKPELFDDWANGGECPYVDCSAKDREWHFQECRSLWQPGEPMMADNEVLREICDYKEIIVED